MFFESFQQKFKESVDQLMESAAASSCAPELVSFKPVYTVLEEQTRQHYENDIKVLIDTIIRETMIKLACVSFSLFYRSTISALKHCSLFDQERSIRNGQLETLLKLSIELARVEECSVNLPIILLGELFDCRTLAECELLFSAVDRNLATWKEELFFKNVKNHLLRICNDLLRRLSRNQNTVFCGRILIFLANFFPLFERSGLNLTSEFNQDNSTTYALQAEEEGSGAGAAGNAENNNGNANTDLNFYRKFWQLQEYFRNPTVCYSRGRFKAFQGHCTDVLAVFAGNKIDADSGFYFQTLSGGKGQPNDQQDDPDQSFFFVKYLTNQKLLELQLNDSNFRRHILIQMLILFQYFTATVKFRSETLTEEQSAWVGDTRRKVFACIEETPPNGAEVRKVLEHLLQREEYWNHWKNEGCKEELKVAAVAAGAGAETEAEAQERQDYVRSTYAGPHKRARLGDYLRSKAGTGKVFMGNADMGRLWNIEPDNMAACRSAGRDFTPNIARYFEEWNGLSSDERSIWCEDSNHCWRTLRLLSARCNHFFVPSNVVVKYVKDYLHGVTDRLAADLQHQQQPTVAVESESAGRSKPHSKLQRDVDPAKNSASANDTEDISDDELLKNEADGGAAGGGGGAGGEEVVEEVDEDMEDLEGGNDLMTTESGTTNESSTALASAAAASAADLLTPAIIEEVAAKLAEHWDAVSPFFGYQVGSALIVCLKDD